MDLAAARASGTGEVFDLGRPLPDAASCGAAPQLRDAQEPGGVRLAQASLPRGMATRAVAGLQGHRRYSATGMTDQEQLPFAHVVTVPVCQLPDWVCLTRQTIFEPLAGVIPNPSMDTSKS